MNSTATPTPTPFDPAATAANVALSNYYLAVGLILAAIAVIVIALGFAWLYHRKALDVIMSSVAKGAQLGSPSNDDVTKLGGGPRIVGPSSAKPSEELFFGLADVDATKTVTWTAEGGVPSSGGEHTFTTTFAAEGEHIVKVDVEGMTEVLEKKVAIGTGAGAASAAPIVIPFVLKNWGRLVIVLFGVGVIAALMATRVISAEAGIGILGALLGVGATAAASGGGGAGNAGTSTGPAATAPDTSTVRGQDAKN